MQKGFDVVNIHGTASAVIATPVIGENGNWYIGNDDTGVSAQGSKSKWDIIIPKTEYSIINNIYFNYTLYGTEESYYITGDLSLEAPLNYRDLRVEFLTLPEKCLETYIPTMVINTSNISGWMPIITVDGNKMYVANRNIQLEADKYSRCLFSGLILKDKSV